MKKNRKIVTKTHSIKKLREVEKELGFIPNLFSFLAESNVSLDAFIDLNDHFANTSFCPTEKELILTAISVVNECEYCVAGHTKFAEIQNVSNDVIHAVRNNNSIKNTKLEALNKFTRNLIFHKGKLPAHEINEFLKAGFTTNNVLEIILGISLKTLSNYTNNFFDVPLDEVFKGHIWNPEVNNQSIL